MVYVSAYRYSTEASAIAAGNADAQLILEEMEAQVMIDKHATPCGVPGPVVQVSAQYDAQVECNRVRGHPGPHQHRHRDTFGVVAEWTKPAQPKPGRHRRDAP